MISELDKLKKELAELDIKAQCTDCWDKLPKVLSRAMEVKKRIKEIENYVNNNLSNSI